MSLKELARKAGDYVLGIPWGRITDDPYRDVYTELQYIVPLREAMRSVMEFADYIDWTWDVYDDTRSEDALVAWYGVREALLTKDSALMAALNVGRSQLSSAEAPVMDLEVFRAFVSQMFSNAMFGFSAHSNLAWQYSEVDPYTIVRNADYTHALCTALRAMYDMGALNPIAKPIAKVAGNAAAVAIEQREGTSGLPIGSLDWSAAALIAVVLLGLAAILAWYLLNSETIEAQKAVMADACRQAALDPSNRKKQKACRDAQKLFERQKPSAPWDVGVSWEIVATFAGIGLLVYAASLAFPNLIRGVEEAVD